jgi:hypothetical protein
MFSNFNSYFARSYVLFSLCSTYSPSWNESLLISIEKSSTPLTFEVMAWSRLTAPAIVGYAIVSEAERFSLLLEDAGHERQLTVPVIKAGKPVIGHDQQQCHLTVRIKVIHAMAKSISV